MTDSYEPPPDRPARPPMTPLVPIHCPDYALMVRPEQREKVRDAGLCDSEWNSDYGHVQILAFVTNNVDSPFWPLPRQDGPVT